MTNEPAANGYMKKGGLVYYKLPCGCNEGVPEHLPRFECRCGKGYTQRVFGAKPILEQQARRWRSRPMA